MKHRASLILKVGYGDGAETEQDAIKAVLLITKAAEEVYRK